MESTKRNCNSCKYGLFEKCKGLKDNEEYQKISNFMKRHAFKSTFICDEYNSRYIEFPIEISKINSNTDMTSYRDDNIGKFVRISPCGGEYNGKTYLGLYLGNLPKGHSISHNKENKELSVSFFTNPAIFVFDLKKIIYGCESWWSIIEDEDDLKEITNNDIDNTWYVKALKSLT